MATAFRGVQGARIPKTEKFLIIFDKNNSVCPRFSPKVRSGCYVVDKSLHDRLALRIIRRGLRAIGEWQFLGHTLALSGPRIGHLLPSRRLNRSGQRLGTVNNMLLRRRQPDSGVVEEVRIVICAWRGATLEYRAARPQLVMATAA